jgi:hypothetical protein
MCCLLTLTTEDLKGYKPLGEHTTVTVVHDFGGNQFLSQSNQSSPHLYKPSCSTTGLTNLPVSTALLIFPIVHSSIFCIVSTV